MMKCVCAYVGAGGVGVGGVEGEEGVCVWGGGGGGGWRRGVAGGGGGGGGQRSLRKIRREDYTETIRSRVATIRDNPYLQTVSHALPPCGLCFILMFLSIT